MIIPAVVIMAAAPVMVQAAGYQIPANATCVEGKALTLTGSFTFNNLDFVEIHYTTDSNRTNPRSIQVTIGETTYSLDAELIGGEYVAKFPVKATNLTVPKITVGITGTGTITVTSASATTDVYQGLVTKYNTLNSNLTTLKAYPTTMKVNLVYPTTDIEALETDLTALKTWLDGEKEKGENLNVVNDYHTKAAALDFTNRESNIKTAVEAKAKAIDDANKEVADAISEAETDLNKTNTYLRNTYSLYTNDLARALQDIQKQRTALTKIKSDNAASLAAQTSDTDEETLLADVKKVETALDKVSDDIAAAKDEKDNKYDALVAQVDAKHTQVADCPPGFATLGATDFSTELQTINEQITAAQYKDAILALNIDTDLKAYNDKVDLFNAAVSQAKDIEKAYSAAVTTIAEVPSQIEEAKKYINGRNATGFYNDAVTDGLYYNKPLSLKGKGSELSTYEQSWNTTNGTLIRELNTKLSEEQVLSYDVLGKADYASTVIAKKNSIDTQKTRDLAAVAAVKKNADDLMTAFSSTFNQVNEVAQSWTLAFIEAKDLLMYNETGYTGYRNETKSYKVQLEEQKAAIKALADKIAAAANPTTKSIAQMLADVRALTNMNGDSEWTTISKAVSALNVTKELREKAYKSDLLAAAKSAAEDAWKTYVSERTLDAFVAPTKVHASVLTDLQNQYQALVARYTEYEGYKNATVDADDYVNQLANFKKVSEGEAAFVNDVNAYIAALDKAQKAFAQNTTIYDAAVAKVNSAKTALGRTADYERHGKFPSYTYGEFYDTDAKSVKCMTAKAYKNGRVATLSTNLDNLLYSIEDAKTACTLYDDWGHDAVKGTLQTQLEALNSLINKIDPDIRKAIALQGTADALEVNSLKSGKQTEVVNACSSDFDARDTEIDKIKDDLNAQIKSPATDKWVVDYEATFNTAKTKFDTNKAALKTKLEGYQKQFNDRNSLSSLVTAAQKKINAAWISPDLDAIEFYNEQLFTIEGELDGLATFMGNAWVAGTDYTAKLDAVKADLEKYVGATTVEGSIDAIVAASKANLAAKGVLEEKAAKLTQQLKHTIELLKANKIEVTVDGVTTVKERTIETDAEKAKQKVALENLEAFFNEKGEISDANVDFSGKSVDTEIADRYALGQAATNQAKVENGILAFYTAINNVMVNLDNDYIGIVNGANEAVKTAFSTAYAANAKAHDDAIAELQEYQNLPEDNLGFRNQVMKSLTEAVTAITEQQQLAEALNTTFNGPDATLVDSDGYYDKNQTAKKKIEGYTAEIGTILSAFTYNVDKLAVDAFKSALDAANDAYNAAKAVLSGAEWTVSTTEFADVKKCIDDAKAAFDKAPTALNYADQVNALNDNKTGYAALIAVDKGKYVDAQVAAYKQNGQDKINVAKNKIEGYTHLTDAHKDTINQGFISLKNNYDAFIVASGITDLWTQMTLVKSNSEGLFYFRNNNLGITTNYDMQAYCNKIAEKALAWDTEDWNTTVCNGLMTELAKVTAIYRTLNGKGYAVLTDAATDYDGWDAAAGEGQKRSELLDQLNDINIWVTDINSQLNATHDRTWLAEAEGKNGTLRTEIANKLASLTGTNDIVAVFDAANSTYTTWKNNKVLKAYKASADVQAAVALAESWIPQNYHVSETIDYNAIVAKVQAVKDAIEAAQSAEEVDYLAFGKGTGTGDNIPALLVEIDKHNDANTLVADMGKAAKTAIVVFENTLAAEKTKQTGYEEAAKSNFSTVETKLAEVNNAYTAALGNGTLVFADVQKAMTDAVAVLTSDLNTLAAKAANDNTIAVKTKNNEAGWTKVQGEYDEFKAYYEKEVLVELNGYVDEVKNTYLPDIEDIFSYVTEECNMKYYRYEAFKKAADKLNASGLNANESIKSTIDWAKTWIVDGLSKAKDAQYDYDVAQAQSRLTALKDELAAEWKTANNTLTSYNTTVQDSFKDEKQAVVDEMAEVVVHIKDGDYALANESALTAQIAALYGKIDALLALAAKNNKGAAGTGDVDGDGIVDLDDYDRLLNFILGTKFSEDEELQAKAEKAADVNNDDRVNVADLQGVLNIYHYGAWNRTKPLEQNNSRRRVAAYLNAAADNMEAEISGAQGVAEIALNLDNGQAYTSFQFDVKLPEGMQFDLVSLTERAEGLDVQTGLLEDGTIRVVATATDATIAAGTGAVARLSIATEGITDGEIVIDNIVFADNFANAKTFNGFALTAGTVTGIAGNASLTQRVVRSIYNAGGQLMDKVQQGINILVGEDGAAKKVIKK